MTQTPAEPDPTEEPELDPQEIDAALAEPADDVRAGLAVLLAPPDGMAERATAELKERLLEKRTIAAAFDLLVLGVRTGRLLISPDPPTADGDDA
ncbi:MAG: hypothetical protein JJLCMIEE_00241 [Acidimicrobiales bacterium]|nr:MAG: hypothetical protein EDR02_01475 [Actinomycetota bacterium]MBV6507200.1 hypothetical protein [Acidimicrobiales bacterium]RIK05513.1 MAG: hypothetical protein DCC48_09455 [Acidobacteriota bacterium]